MKTWMIFAAFISLSGLLCAQNPNYFDYQIDFDSEYSMDEAVILDSSSTWQIGIPDKTVFDSAFSPVHAILTDTTNPYPVNDTSSFIIRHLRPIWPGAGNESLQLNFMYRMNTDSLTDYGLVEASIDNGETWINLIDEADTYGFYWLTGQEPVLTGNTDGWQTFGLELSSLTYELGLSDTLLYRFTFISDGIQTNKDGWMIDNFDLIDSWESKESLLQNKEIRIYPNPTSGTLHIEGENFSPGSSRMDVYDISGKLLIQRRLHSSSTELDLPAGMYFIRIAGKEITDIQKIIIK
ncbi:MAG: T9SS type A sorting domain-containing protein [Bacteroidales bacterium]